MFQNLIPRLSEFHVCADVRNGSLASGVIAGVDLVAVLKCSPGFAHLLRLPALCFHRLSEHACSRRVGTGGHFLYSLIVGIGRNQLQ